GQEPLGALGPLAVFGLHLLEEGRQLLVAGLTRVLDVLLARLTPLERVIEDADEVVLLVGGTGDAFAVGHLRLLDVSRFFLPRPRVTSASPCREDRLSPMLPKWPERGTTRPRGT